MTAAVGTIGNMRGLCLTLQSIIGQVRPPDFIKIYACGDVGDFGDFYLQSLIASARLRSGIQVEIKFTDKMSIDRMYDLMVAESETPWLWLCNDDVFYDPKCLNRLYRSARRWDVQAICGTKVDVINRRGYRNWSSQAIPTPENPHPHQLYIEPEKWRPEVYRRLQLDLGNALLDTRTNLPEFMVLSAQGQLQFGEDWVWGAKCQDRGIETFMTPHARAYHLDKPSGSPFSRYTTERQLIESVLDRENLPTEILSEWGAS